MPGVWHHASACLRQRPDGRWILAVLRHLSAPLRLLKTLSDRSDEKCDKGVRVVRRGRRRGVRGGACSLSAISGQCPSVNRCCAMNAGPKWQKANKLRHVYWPASRGRTLAITCNRQQSAPEPWAIRHRQNAETCARGSGGKRTHLGNQPKARTCARASAPTEFPIASSDKK